MTDRELLEFAAYAIDLKVTGWIDSTHEWFQHEGVAFNDEYDCQQCWNPLLNELDAFRLAIKLGINCHPGQFPKYVYDDDLYFTCAESTEHDIWKQEEWSLTLGNQSVAMRRAIVLVAAEIGKKQYGKTQTF
jgi:hypothetical protein